MTVNRRRLAERHNPVLKAADPFSPLSVGNGELAFTADITGMQSFPLKYKVGMPLCTQSQWGWHTTPVSKEKYSYDLSDLEFSVYEANGRRVGYPTRSEGQVEVYNWLRTNPHRLHLGQIGIKIKLQDGNPAELKDLTEVEQKLDMWKGLLTSFFSVEGTPVTTKTCCHPEADILSFSVESPLLQMNRIEIEIAFPYGSPDRTAADWCSDDRHSTEVINDTGSIVDLLRILDRDRYFVGISVSTGAEIKRTGRNSFVISPACQAHELKFSVMFTETPRRTVIPTFDETTAKCEEYWESYWKSGGVIELCESTDERAFELERRIVLSQYLTAIQCAGSMPPQETGLTCNSWCGRFHLEMHWWHGVHFALWGRPELFERSMWWYRSILPKAKELAESQGYRGCRWPKMPAYDGISCPSPIAPLLIWQQPHPIYYAELLYLAKATPETLDIFKDIVFETAEFMASFAVYDEASDCYNLGPSIIPAQENHNPVITVNPTYELEYWAFGLRTANEWRKRLGLEINALWEEIAEKLAPLPVKEGVYLAHENCPDTFERFNYDHPSMLAALGVLSGEKADRDIMLSTLNKVIKEWRLDSVWGWDFPMMAMTAARLGQPGTAIDMLLYDSPKNIYLPNGHNRQVTQQGNPLAVESLPLYLPGNGGLLAAAAMMAAGWAGCSEKDAPGFPKDGKWKISWEGLKPML